MFISTPAAACGCPQRHRATPSTVAASSSAEGYGGQESDRTTTHKLPPTTPPARSHLLRKPRAARAPGPYTKASGGKKTRAKPATTLKTPPHRSCGNPMPPHLRMNNSAPREAANRRHRQPLLWGMRAPSPSTQPHSPVCRRRHFATF